MITNKTCLAVFALFVGACVLDAFAFESNVILQGKGAGSTPVVVGYATAFENGEAGNAIGTEADIRNLNSVVGAGWSGDGTYVSTKNGDVVEYNSPSGVPYVKSYIEDSEDKYSFPWQGLTTNTAVLVEGDLVFTNDLSWCEAAGENGVAVEGVSVDFMIRVSHPDEPPTLEDEGEATNELQVCICAWTNGLEEVELESMTDEQRAANAKVPLYLYCKDGDDTFGGDDVPTVTTPANLQWVPLGKSVTTGSWIRVNLLIDYDHNTCRVSVDGDPCVTSKGFNKADSGTASSGAWYKLANQVKRNNGDMTKSKIPATVNTLKFSGEAAIDNVVVQKVDFDEFKPYVNPDGTPVTTNVADIAIDMNFLDDYGVSFDELDKARADNTYSLETGDVKSGMTLLQKAEAGIDPRSPEKFEMKTMEQEDVEAGTQVAITFPGVHDVSHYSVTVAADPKGTNPLAEGKVTGASVAKENGANKWTGTISRDAPAVRYFILKANANTTAK